VRRRSTGLRRFDGRGSLSNRPDHADRGKRALLWSLGGVVITAIAIPVINTVFGAVH
jgi:hypothetical protein